MEKKWAVSNYSHQRHLKNMHMPKNWLICRFDSFCTCVRLNCEKDKEWNIHIIWIHCSYPNIFNFGILPFNNISFPDIHYQNIQTFKNIINNSCFIIMQQIQICKFNSSILCFEELKKKRIETLLQFHFKIQIFVFFLYLFSKKKCIFSQHFCWLI